MAYSYCKSCGNELDEPTIQEVVDDDYECPECYTKNHIPKTLGEVVLELAERIVELESKIAKNS